MMLAEVVLAALGDEFAYIQDRHAREAYLETHTTADPCGGRLDCSDFEIHDGRSPSTLLELCARKRAHRQHQGRDQDLGTFRDARARPVRDRARPSPGGRTPTCLPSTPCGSSGTRTG